MKKRKNFSSAIKLKALSCCDRHCCLCGKQCDTNIEVHHIIPATDKQADNSFDNAIPLCYDCHAKVEISNNSRGTKYSREELKQRRDQIYSRFTSPYLPNIHFEIIGKDKNNFAKANFSMFNKHQYLSCKVKTIFSVFHRKKLIHKFDNGVYGGKILWNMNPESGVTVPANFLKMPANKRLPKKIVELQVQVEVTIIDQFGWKHNLLPVSWIYTPSVAWYYEPFSVRGEK